MFLLVAFRIMAPNFRLIEAMVHLLLQDQEEEMVLQQCSLKNLQINTLYRTITGRKPNKKEVTMLKEYFNEENSKNEDEIAFDKLCMLIYNLDETSQKS